MTVQVKKTSRILVLLAVLLSTCPTLPAAAAPTFDVALLPGWFTAPAAGDGPAIEPDLARALASASDEPLHIIVILQSPDGLRRPAAAVAAGPDRLRVRTALVDALQSDFNRSREPLAPLLAEAASRGELLARRDLWIIRGMALTARPTLIHRLTTSTAVAEIRLDPYELYLDPQEASGPESADAEGMTWGLAQIRAPEVWQTLGISGTGAVVAIMDTGVELLHPAIADNYRGNLGRGLYDHSASWYDAVGGGTYPYDDFGHGTHVAGTAVGVGDIGVAPAARWIGVKVLSGAGYGYESWIHAGFQWLLAPGGDPAQAPDVVNASWSSTSSSSTAFQADIQALLAAGIFPVFAAGNSGPSLGSVGSPASLPGVFAVGANDPDADVAYFSGRGPSPWGEVKPYVVAPGVNVLSSVPGGAYQYGSGTSMATPHVAGLIALMRSVSPTIAVDVIARTITQTAIPLTTTAPNNDSGWGRVDAFAALVAITHPGIVRGTVRAIGGQGIHGASVVAAPHGSAGNPAQVTSDAAGDYALLLAPGTYDVTASAFGYTAQTVWNVAALTDTQQQVDFTLAPLPTGVVWGRVTVSGTGATPTRTVALRVINTPLTTTVDASGYYAFSLPTGIYTIEIRGLGYRIITATVSIIAGDSTTHDFVLSPVPTLLLVDEGAWYYGSRLSYWREALDALMYACDETRIKYPAEDTPISTTLASYDIVLWSSPLGSPGLVNGGDALRDYMDGGGRLLVSGQDVAYFDGFWDFEAYLSRMGVQYDADDASSRVLTGLGPFAGLGITITGEGGANNQALPDIVSVGIPDLAFPLWDYASGGNGGVAASTCTPYRSMFFSFGYEAINNPADRREVMKRTLDWLNTPIDTVGLAFKSNASSLIGIAGTQVTHTLLLRHVGYAGQPDTVTLTLNDNRWPAVITPTTAVISPCEWLTITVVVSIPADTGVDRRDTLTITTDSTFVASGPPATLHTKTPAPVLLVDDDRWYPMEERYKSALSARGIPFDVWDMHHNLGGRTGDSSPPTDTLKLYPIIVWFTGYDWYAPILKLEVPRILAYLDGGGRFLLSSQDFLYYHDNDALAQRLGVLTWREHSEITAASGVPDQPAGGSWGPIALTYPFSNWSDAIEPVPDAAPVMRGQSGQPIGIAAGDPGPGDARTLFYSFPLETLPDATRADALSRAVGWLSPLGNSTWEITPTAPLPGERVASTLVLRNDGLSSLMATVTHTLPATLTLVVDTLPPAMTYNPTLRTIAWTGPALPNAPITFTWAATVTGNAGDPLIPTVTLGLPEWGLAFERKTYVYIDGADLAASRWISPEWATLRPRTPVTLEFALHNAGPGAVISGETKLWLMWGLAPMTSTLTEGWEWNLAPGETRILTIPVEAGWWDRQLRIDALLEGSEGQRLERRLWLTIKPWRAYLPLVLKRY